MKTITLDTVGEVKLKKSARAKRIILKIDRDGAAVVVLPRFTPYIVGEQFAKANVAWIIEHTASQKSVVLDEGYRVGESHTLHFRTQPDVTTPRSRVQSNFITVTLPENMPTAHTNAQSEAYRAVTRAIRRQAEQVLPQMLYSLAQKHRKRYASVSVKNMRSRWGSCSSHGVIALNIWLMQVPNELKEYVLCHELAHLNNPHHQTAFWETLEQMVPDYRKRRRELKRYQPNL